MFKPFKLFNTIAELSDCLNDLNGLNPTQAVPNYFVPVFFSAAGFLAPKRLYRMARRVPLAFSLMAMRSSALLSPLCEKVSCSPLCGLKKPT